MVTSTTTSGFEAQFQTFVNYAGPIVQLLYWIAIAFAAVWAAYQLKRWVDAQVAAKQALAEQPEAPAAAEKKTKPEAIKVEDFVE